ncbi:ABC transporter permease [Skermanella aerolata]|uniref:ABC transporter permease n=1 Tax=Skermanella aerolata TaxID=393310 RepID=A0A512DN27_9PROT|nr:ABC transporter permease [Skermanella aerolata]KJB96394.1 ABC transporter permease [Skermanella aerolata KACC 11604]GEO37570.1 ABC transporter permease [Skermanella aerolata]
MSTVALLGAAELGLVFALVALGVFISFRVLDFPDLTVDGSFPLGAAVAATLILADWNPWVATGIAMLAGAASGIVTATLNVRFKILHLLASILTMIALFSINLRVMGRPNVAILIQDTVLTPFYDLGQTLGLSDAVVRPLFVLAVVLVVVALLARFLTSEFGLAMRATGVNARMARAQGVSTDLHIYVGMALSNALVGLAGALFAQTNGFADVTSGIGTIVIGLAAVIVGETVVRSRVIVWMLVGCVVGSILYRIAIQVALNADFIGLRASDLNLVTALLVAGALILPRIRNPLKARAGAEATSR